MRHRCTLIVALLVAAPLVAQGRAERLARADSLAAAGDSAGAIAVLDSVVRHNGRDAAAWHQLGLLAWNMSRESRRKTVVNDSKQIRLLAQADSALKLAAQLAPDSARYQQDLGKYLLTFGSTIGRLPAGRSFRRALGAAERTGDSVTLSAAEDEIGMVFWRRYEPFQKRAMTATGVPLPPLDSLVQGPERDLDNALESSVIPLPESGDLDYLRAVDRFTRAVRANPNNASALKHVFMALAEQERWEEMGRMADVRLGVAPWDPWAWLARGLASHRLGRTLEAQAAYDSALTFLSPADRARYTQLSRILRPTDSLKLAQMSPAERAATERMYWMMADPLMLTPGNEHWLEFLSRVAFAELRWTSDDWGLRGADTDRGVVYVRFGPPSTIMTLGGNTGSVSLLWRYDDGLSFHFALIPSLGVAHFGFDAREFAKTVLEERPVSWRNLPVTRTLDSIPTQVARFRAGAAAGDSSDVVVFAALPVGRLAHGVELRDGRIDVGFFAFDAAARVVARDSSSERLRYDTLDSAATVMRSWRRRLRAAGSLGVRVEALERAAMRGARALAAVDPGGGGFEMSDVLVADRLAPREGSAASRWSDMVITPSVGALARGQQFGVMWETYELAATPEGSNRYRVQLELRRTDRSKLSRLMARVLAGTIGSAEARARKNDRQVAMSFTRETPARPVALDYLTLSLGDTPRGSFRLTITVTDLVSGKVATRAREVTVGGD